MTTAELESEMDLMRRNNPEMTEVKLREAMFKRAMQATCDEILEEVRHLPDVGAYIRTEDVHHIRRKIR